MQNKGSNQLPEHETRLALVLDTLAVVRKQDSFKKAATALCDTLRDHFKCTQVSLGWIKRGNTVLEAISGKPDFEKSMELVRVIQNSMDEAVFSSKEILVNQETKRLPANHRLLQGMSSSFNLMTMPIETSKACKGAVVLQKRDKPFTEHEVIAVRLILENTVSIFETLYKKDQGVTAKAVDLFKGLANRIFQQENSLSIALGLILFSLTLAAFFIKIPYRLSCNFIVRSQNQAVLSARTSGYLKSVFKKQGDFVKKDDLMARLDSSEKTVMKMELQAELEKHLNQVSIYRNENKLGQMMISKASAKHTQVRIKRVELAIEKTFLKAPIEGVVIRDRELYQKLNLPIKEGDELMVIADLKKLFAEIHFPEESLFLLKKECPAYLRFISRPEKDFPVSVNHISPAAVNQNGKNIFILRSYIKVPSEWCRPGMTGQCYLDAGLKSPAWIVFYRIADWLRMNLWW